MSELNPNLPYAEVVLRGFARGEHLGAASAALVLAELDRLRRVEAAAKALLEGEFQYPCWRHGVEFAKRRVAELRTALGVTS